MAALSLMVALSACSDGGSSRGPTPSIRWKGHTYEDGQLSGSVSALCSVAEKARSDEKSAYDEFLNRSHSVLHVIAGAAQSKDRRVAAKMLIAMEALETTFESNGSPEKARSQAQTLIKRSNHALETLSISAVRCP